MSPITAEELMHVEVSPSVENFMKSHGTTHLKLIDQWLKEPEYRDNYQLLIQELAYAYQNHARPTVAQRILGRLAVIRRRQEKASLTVHFSGDDDVLS